MAARGRKPSTGRYETQAELEDAVEFLYWSTKASMAAIARNVKVGEARVAKLVDLIGKRRAAVQNATEERRTQ